MMQRVPALLAVPTVTVDSVSTVSEAMLFSFEVLARDDADDDWERISSRDGPLSPSSSAWTGGVHRAGALTRRCALCPVPCRRRDHVCAAAAWLL